MYPLLKKPLEQIGTYIDVPGNYWQGCMSAEEKETNYRCLVRDHSAMAPLTPTRKGEGFQLQEMGVTAGTGSLEHGDASGEIRRCATCRTRRTSRRTFHVLGFSPTRT